MEHVAKETLAFGGTGPRIRVGLSGAVLLVRSPYGLLCIKLACGHSELSIPAGP